MHSRKIAKDIINHVNKNYGKEVKKVTISFGELVGISKEHIGEILKREAQWTVRFTSERSHIECLCGYEGPARISDRGHDYVMFECPQCGSPLPKLIKGNEIKVVKVEKR